MAKDASIELKDLDEEEASEQVKTEPTRPSLMTRVKHRTRNHPFARCTLRETNQVLYTGIVRRGGADPAWLGSERELHFKLRGLQKESVRIYVEILSGLMTLAAHWIGSAALDVKLLGNEDIQEFSGIRLSSAKNSGFRGLVNLTVQERTHPKYGRVLTVTVLSAERLADALTLVGMEPEHDHRYLAVTGVGMAIFLIIGVLFYMSVEGWDFSSSLYFCVVILTTVGYGDMLPTTDGSKIFTVFFILLGIGLIAHGLALLGAVFIDNQTEKLSLMLSGQGDKEKEKPRWHFIRVFCLLLLSLLIGVIFFVAAGEMTFVDGLYTAVCTVSTIGLGDFSPAKVTPLDNVGHRWFGILWLLFGTITFGSFVGFIVDSIVDSRTKEKAARYLQFRVRDVEDLQELDHDNDGKVTEMEWMRHFLCTGLAKCEKKVFDDIAKQFHDLDRDKNGYLSKEDFAWAQKRGSVEVNRLSLNEVIAETLNGELQVPKPEDRVNQQTPPHLAAHEDSESEDE